jgi:hypothetical protein
VRALDLSDYFALPVGRAFDISPDGRRFLVMKETLGSGSDQINVVVDWVEELKRLVPVD